MEVIEIYLIINICLTFFLIIFLYSRNIKLIEDSSFDELLLDLLSWILFGVVISLLVGLTLLAVYIHEKIHKNNNDVTDDAVDDDSIQGTNFTDFK